MKYQTSFGFCRNACIQLLNWEDIEIVWRWNARLWSSQLSFLIILQLYPGLQVMGEQEDCLILANGAFGRKAPVFSCLLLSSLLKLFIWGALFSMLPEVRRQLFNGPNGLTQPCMQRLWDNSPVQCSKSQVHILGCNSWPCLFSKEHKLYLYSFYTDLWLHHSINLIRFKHVLSTSQDLDWCKLWDFLFLISFKCRVLLTSA